MSRTMKMLFFEVNQEQQQYFKKCFPITVQTIPQEHTDTQVISIFIF